MEQIFSSASTALSNSTVVMVAKLAQLHRAALSGRYRTAPHLPTR